MRKKFRGFCKGDPVCLAELDRVLNIRDMSGTTLFGMNTCIRWCIKYRDNKLKDRMKNEPFKKIQVQVIEWEYTGRIPGTEIHCAIKIIFPNGKFGYLDQGWYGGLDDHIFFPEDLKGKPLKQPDQRFGKYKRPEPLCCPPLKRTPIDIYGP